MRVALAHSHANTLGGGERALLELARGLGGRHELRLLLGRYAPRHTYPELEAFPRVRLARLQWPLARLADDAIVANSFGANLLALRNGARVACWVHSTRSRFLQPGARRVDLRLRRALASLAVRRAALLVANSQFTAAQLRRLHGRETDAVVYPGVDLDLFQPGPGDGGFAVTVGRLAPEKGLDRLLQLWRELPELPLHVVGGGSAAMVRELRAAAPTNVVFHGPLLPAAVAAIYRHAAVAVFAARGEEFGIAPLEAMAAGVPVVAWREGGLLESVVDGRTGYLVADEATFRQRVRLLTREAALRQELGQLARGRAEGFSWGRTVAAIEALCARLAARRSAPPAAAPRSRSAPRAPS